MPGAVFLEGDGLTLNTIEEEDLPFLRDTINAPAVRAGLLYASPVNLDQEREFYEEVVCDDDSVHLLICADGEAAGAIGFESEGEVAAADTVEIGLFLAEEFWGRGYGTEAARLITDFACMQRGHHRVEARVRAGNEASERIWETLGFRHEATHREAAFHDGEFVDLERYAVLSHEWSG